jgi:hypothetical protein
MIGMIFFCFYHAYHAACDPAYHCYSLLSEKIVLMSGALAWLHLSLARNGMSV